MYVKDLNMEIKLNKFALLFRSEKGGLLRTAMKARKIEINLLNGKDRNVFIELSEIAATNVISYNKYQLNLILIYYK